MSTVEFIGIRRVAAKFGVTSASVRRWERVEKLPPSIRTPGGQRAYPAAAVERLVRTTDAKPPRPK